MDFSIASILMLDGVTNGAIYALLGLATVLVFTVTRVIFIPQGEFVAYGALTLAMLQTGKVPGTVWLLLIMAAAGGPDGGRGALAPQRTSWTRLEGRIEDPDFSGRRVGPVHLGRTATVFAAGAGAAERGHRHRFRPAGLPGGLPVARRSPARWCC